MRIKGKRKFSVPENLVVSWVSMLMLVASMILAACGATTTPAGPAATIQPAISQTRNPLTITSPPTTIFTTLAPTATVVPPTPAPGKPSTPLSGPVTTRGTTVPASSVATQPTTIQQIFDLSFINARQGWAIGSICEPPGKCRVAIRKTTDGGHTWQTNAAPPVEPAWVGETGNTHKVRYLHFADSQDGWAFGPGLYTTHDGGASWQADNRPEEVIALSSVGKTVWAITRACSQPAVCSIGMLVSTDSGRAWKNLEGLPRIPGPEAQLLALTAQDSWLLSWGTPYSPSGNAADLQAGPTLLVTHDGGQSWQTLTNPCMQKGWIEARLAISNPQQPWLVCGGLPGAGQQIKYLYQSGDGGRNWQEVAAKLGGGGYINSLAVSAPGKLWLALVRGTLINSNDGGLTWKPAIPYEVANPGDGGVGPVVFADANHGWLAAAQGRVFLTVDGGKSWQPVDLN